MMGRAKAIGKAQEFFRTVVVPYESDECLIWPFSKTKNGYGYIAYKGRRTTVNNAVCEEKHGPAPSPKHEGAHSCRNSACANYRHLRWATGSENQMDRVRDGTSNRGERCAQAVLTRDQVLEIRALRGTKSNAKLGAIYGVSRGTIGHIMRRTTWGWL
jgi:hypothetical protein